MDNGVDKDRESDVGLPTSLITTCCGGPSMSTLTIPSSLCTVVYPHVTVQSEVRGAATVAHQTDDTSAWRRMDTSLAKMAILSLELMCFSPPSFEGHNSVVTGGTPGLMTSSQ